jgi:hypothetical protein
MSNFEYLFFEREVGEQRRRRTLGKHSIVATIAFVGPEVFRSGVHCVVRDGLDEMADDGTSLHTVVRDGRKA